MGRRFTKRQRIAVYLATGRSGEADHIKPFSKGGETSVENLQFISPTANRKKGAFEFCPRLWQLAFLEKWESRRSGSPFLLIAVPAGGKTWAALEAARAWVNDKPRRQLAVVVPTNNLQEQWKQEAVLFGLELKTREFTGSLDSGYDGIAVTYAFVHSQEVLLRKYASQAETLVIFDEIHHCGDDKAYGEKVKYAFENTTDKLLMSGTPWKTDGTPIPFVNYDEQGVAVGDYEYSHQQALNDGVVRHVVFDFQRGDVTNLLTQESETLHQDTDDERQSLLLRQLLLDVDGDYVTGMLRVANEKLNELRSRTRDAAALALCIDKEHARRVASKLEQLTGERPTVILSDDPTSNDVREYDRKDKRTPAQKIKEFAKGHTKWIVAVKMVSEGTNIKRLQCLCYLTNTTSLLFFHQAIGRVTRVRGIQNEGFAQVVIPAAPTLVQHAKSIEAMQRQACKLQEEKQQDEERKARERSSTAPLLTPYSTDHGGTDVMLVNSEEVDGELIADTQMLSQQLNVEPEKVLAILRHRQNKEMGRCQEAGESDVPLEDLATDLRRQCTTLVRKLAYHTNKSHNDIHIEACGGDFKKQEQMTVGQLERKLQRLRQMFAGVKVSR